MFSKMENYGLFIKSFWILLPVLVGWILGFSSSYFMWKCQTRYELRNIARALYKEISSIEDRLKLFAEIFMNPLSGLNGENPVKIDQPLYNDGLFFSFRKEISSFDKELSNRLFQFYLYLLEAEKCRQVGKEDMFFKPANKAMKDNIVDAYRLLPNLKKLLEKKC